MKHSFYKLLFILSTLTIAFSQLEFIPADLDMGPTTVDSIFTFDIQIVSGVAQTVSFSGLEAPFSVDPEVFVFEQEALSNDTLSATITFNPDEVQIFNDTLHAEGSIWGIVDLPIVAEGVLVGISLSENELDFGDVSIGQSNTLVVTLTNNGVGTMTTSILSDNHQYTIDPILIELGTDQSADINITFAPDTAGTTNTLISFASNDPVNPLVNINVTGVGKTDIAGEISGIWNPGNNPYHIIGHVNIPNDSTLIIAPGVEVVFDGYYQFYVYGSLYANGTPDNVIKFSGNGNFSFDYTDNPIETSYCNFGDISLEEYEQALLDVTFYENFEMGHDGWSYDGNANNFDHQESYDGSSALRIYYNGNNSSHTTNIYSPYFELEEEQSFSFWRRTDWSNSCNYHFKVYISIDDGGWQEIYYDNCEATTWSQINISLLDYSGNARFKFENNFYDWGDLRIDSIIIGDMPNYNTGRIYSNNSEINLNNCQLFAYYVYTDNDASVTLDNSIITLSHSGYDCIRTTGNYSEVTLTNSALKFCTSDGIETNGTESYVILNNSSIDYGGYYGIYTGGTDAYITLDNSSVSNSTSDGIRANSNYSPITITNSTVDDNGSYGLFADGSYSPIEVYSSSVSDNNSYGIHTNDNYSPITVHDSYINDNGSYGMHTNQSWSAIEVKRTDVIGNGSSGIYMSGTNNSQDHTLVVEYSRVIDNGGHGLYSNGMTDVDNSIIIDNYEYGIRTCYSSDINHSTIIDNRREGVSHDCGYFLDITNSILFDNDWIDYHCQIDNNGYLSVTYSIVEAYNSFGVSGGNFYQGPGILPHNPLISDEYGHFSENSPAVDGGEPWQHDDYMPPGLGTLIADMGAYGGPNNAYWGGSDVPEGNPEIVDIQDLPQDQGGWIGIQFNGSIFDYDHFGYDITHYSFWRALDYDGADSSLSFGNSPSGHFFRNGRDDEYYWEHVGDMGALNHDNYGYSAPTLGDSTSAGIFLTTFMVVAHTDTEDIYFMSEPASGYSIDNLAPATPAMMSTTIEGSDVSLVWSGAVDDDFTHFNLYRDDELLTTLYDSTYVDTEMAYGAYVEYAVSATDIHENESPQSPIEGFYVNTPGDVDANYNLDVIDLILIIGYIMSPENSDFDEVQLSIADHNNDGIINIIDVVMLVNIIVDNSGLSRSIADGANLYLKENTLSHDANGLVSYQFTLEHESGVEFTLTKSAMIAESVTQGSRTTVIIVAPEAGVLITSDSPFQVLESLAASGDSFIDVNMAIVPSDFVLKAAYPNPFNPTTTIEYGLPEASQVSVSVFDVSGRLIQELADGVMDAGYHSHTWNASMVSSGVYFIHIETAYGISNQKIMLMK